MTTSIMWFRRDLRLSDNPALVEASAADHVVPAFVMDPRLMASAGPRRKRLASSLAALSADMGGALVVRSGNPADVLAGLASEVGARQVHVSAEVTPFGRRRDDAVSRHLSTVGAELVATGSPYAVTPGRLRNSSGNPFRVFSSFRKAWAERGWRRPAARPDVAWRTGIAGDTLEPAAIASGEGERAAVDRWEEFRGTDLGDYDKQRDRPDLDRTSRLSVALKFGELHPRTLLADLHSGAHWDAGAERFETELAWREFYADVLWHAPDSAWRDWKNELADLRYDDDPDLLEAWCTGRTGYPFVDAGMRQLLSQGWMHNRARMVTASFLVKDLHVWWPHGARHFLAHLIDGDVASNSHGWQWVAGTGTDAAPYFRVFNPVVQGLRFDPDGDYVRRWVPELRHLHGPSVHEPWRHADGYRGGYPARIVEHDVERRESLARLDELKRGRT